MEYLPGGLTLELADGTFPLSTDSLLLAHFIKLPRNARVLDLGSGCGTLGHLLCAKDPGCAVTGIEITQAAHQAALGNIARNRLQNRLESICADLRALPPEISSGGFDACVSNPPYFTGGPASSRLPIARQTGCCAMEDLFAAADRALKYGGYFWLVHKPEQLAQLITTGACHHLEAKRLRLTRHKEGSPINLILLQFKKGGKPGLILDEICLFDSRGEPTAQYREVYHI